MIAGIGRTLDVALQAASRGAPRRRSADRQLLEELILPTLALDRSIKRVLFCGCAPYTQAYESLFPHSEYWTLDPSSRRQRFGSKLHIIDRLEVLNRHAVGTFDLIICNGVLGWGIRELAQAEAAIRASYAALVPGGRLLLGWNDVAPRNRVRPEHIAALAAFTPASLARLGARVRAPGWHRHVFDFYRKACDGVQAGSEMSRSASSTFSSSSIARSPSATIPTSLR